MLSSIEVKRGNWFEICNTSIPTDTTNTPKCRAKHLGVCRSLIFFTTNLRYSLSNVLRKSTIDSPQTQLNHGFRCSTKSRRPQDEWIIRSYSAEIFLPRMRTGWELQMSPSDHYWRRYLVGQWLVFGWFGGCGTSDTRLARRKLGKKTHPNHGGRRRPTAAMVPPPRRRRKQQSSNMLCNKSKLLKLENIIVFIIN